MVPLPQGLSSSNPTRAIAMSHRIHHPITRFYRLAQGWNRIVERWPRRFQIILGANQTIAITHHDNISLLMSSSRARLRRGQSEAWNRFVSVSIGFSHWNPAVVFLRRYSRSYTGIMHSFVNLFIG